MKFKKTINGYSATRKDGKVVTIERSGYDEGIENTWVSRTEGDCDGDCTMFAATKKELVLAETRMDV